MDYYMQQLGTYMECNPREIVEDEKSGMQNRASFLWKQKPNALGCIHIEKAEMSSVWCQGGTMEQRREGRVRDFLDDI